MAHIQDRWYRKVVDPVTGKVGRERTNLYGVGDRYKVRYLDPDGRERSKSFPDRQKKTAEDFLIGVENDKREGKYLDPARGRMSVQTFGEQWRAAQTFDYTTRERIGGRLRVHVYPYFEGRSLASVKPTDIQGWVRWLQDNGVSQNYRVLLFTHLASILNAAIDDKRILINPCHAKSVSRPRADQAKIEVWSHQRAHAVREALPDRYKIVVTLGAGCGLRQGEVFGLSPDDVDPEGETVNVVRQVRLVNNRPVFAPPKRGKTRSVPLPAGVAKALESYAKEFEPVELTLPWLHPGGKPVTVRLVLVDDKRRACRRSAFNWYVWRPALVKAKVAPSRADGMHALRHLYASVLLDAGESIKALAQYLGHEDPGFTLRVYTHLLPTSHERTRKAIDAFLAESDRAA
ncbi:MAG TPA: site-specific integrase [Actinophytocola sp.]|uniref:tyrosine-type recombinase/integrase n=1 Tax=Actinophytocola sp. TaxID=1872138 RepID=UPI002DBEF1F1|nr:site-specific integrase [Actinophytocola sp.]HEU5472045.1 site-specific integrase [Actinophytocola sp.]